LFQVELRGWARGQEPLFRRGSPAILVLRKDRILFERWVCP
jgi:hypothetical protein